MSSKSSAKEQARTFGSDDAAAPCELVLELSRAEDTEDPFGFRFVEQTYLLRQPGGAYASATFPWDAAILDDLGALQQAQPDPMVRQRLGERLRTFLEGAGWSALEDETARALDQGRPVHLTVRSSAAELYALPWELVALRDTGQHLGELPGCLLRYEWPGTETAAPEPAPPRAGGRILVAWSAAGGPVPAAEHVAAVRQACAQGHHAFTERDVLDHVSLQRLREALDEEPVAVLHILCHGAALDEGGAGYGLVWNAGDAAGGRAIIDAGPLRQVLAPHAGTLRLVVLSACHGGSAGAPGNHLGSVAQALHRVGIPAVVTSRMPLSVRGSMALVEALYQRLLVDLGSLEEAFLTARQRLAATGEGLDWAALQLYARSADGPAHRPVVFRPYRGLAALTAADRRFFFGRDTEADALVAALRDGQRLLALVGASGSGKSSLVLAGVVPRVQEGALVRVMHPGARPGQTLASILDGAAQARDEKPGAHLLLVIDQFEELFTQAQDRAEVAAFVTRLLAVTEPSAGAISVVLTLRADFLGKCLELDRALAARIDASMRLVLPMDEAQLHTVIVAPAARVGLHVDQAVVDALLDELRVDPAEESVGQVGAGTGNLPLLAFVLQALWERRQDNRITWAAWEAIGGLRGAIAQRADEVLAGCASARRRRLVRDIFSRLVQLGQGTEDTRRYATRAELESIAPGQAGAELQHWIDARLLAVDEDEVWVAHEAVIRAWGTLQRWLAESREALLVQQDVGRAAERWEDGGRSADDLWRGDRLRQAQVLREAGRLRLAAVEAAFLDASEAARRAAVEAAEAQRRRELARARKSRQRSRWLALAAVVVAVIMGAQGLWARAKEHEAEAQRREAEAQRNEAQRLRALAEERAIAARDAFLMAGARELLAREQSEWAMRVLLEVQRPREARGWTALVWKALEEHRPLQVLAGHEGEILSAAFSPDGKRVVTASTDGTARVWRSDGSGAPVVLQGHTDSIRCAAFGPDGQRVVTASADGTARVWRSDGSGAPVVLQGHAGALYSAAFSADGERVVTASADGTARVWRSDGSGAPVVLEGHAGAALSAAFDPGGARVVTASSDGTARVWQADGSGTPVVLQGHERSRYGGNAVLAAAFAPDGKWVVTGGMDGTARVWRADGSGMPVVLQGHDGMVSAVAFGPDARRVLTAASDEKTVRVWHANGRGPPLALRLPGSGMFGKAEYRPSASFGPDGQRVVTTFLRRAGVWEIGIPALQRRLREAGKDCLPVDLREIYLGESEQKARAGHEACEQR